MAEHPSDVAPLPRSSGAALVVMGVSGSGKSTIAAAVAARSGALFLDADDFHPPANTAKMAAGTPLTDGDRRPWLSAVGGEIARRRGNGRSVVLACSALRRSYRDILREHGGDLVFAHLHGSFELLAARLSTRAGHFMPPSLLASQLGTLELLEPDETGFAVGIDQPVAEVVTDVVAGWRSLCDLAS